MTAAARQQRIDAATRAVQEHLGGRTPSVAVVLGSGLGAMASQVTDPVVIPYARIPGFPPPTVEGHRGELLCGTLGGKTVLMQNGRFHCFEGHDADTAALPARVFATLGIRTLLLTNAAGGARRTFRPGTLMLLADHLNLTGQNPLRGEVLDGEIRFPDMSEPYDRRLRDLAHRVALAQGTSLEEGVYAGLLGPNYETPAEVRMLERLGADAIGMSTVLEVIAARARGMRCLAVSTVTNPAAGIQPAPLSHAEVVAMAGEVGERVGRLLEGIIAEL